MLPPPPPPLTISRLRLDTPISDGLGATNSDPSLSLSLSLSVAPPTAPTLAVAGLPPLRNTAAPAKPSCCLPLSALLTVLVG